MTTLTIQIPDNEKGVISSISELLKNVKGSHIEIDDDGLSENELASLKEGLLEVAMIKKGLLKPLSMDDLWDE